MLLRNTVRYLPAQLLPAICQFISLIAWSHILSAEDIGVVTIMTATQEVLNNLMTGFWIQYTIRHADKFQHSENREEFNRTTFFVITTSCAIQSLIIAVVYAFSFPSNVSFLSVSAVCLLTSTRAMNLLQAERARASGDILLYSVSVMSGPVFGLPIGIGLVTVLGNSANLIFLGFAIAQATGVVLGLRRDHSWLKLGSPNKLIVLDAVKYGAPLMISGFLSWVTQNAPRIATSTIISVSAAGMYSVGFGLGYRASMVASLAVTAAAFPIAVKMSNSGDEKGALRQLSVNGTILIALVLSSVVGLGMLARDMLPLLLTPSVAKSVTPILLASLPAGLFFCVKTYYFNQVFLLKKSTNTIAILSLVEAASSAILSYTLIAFGGAIYAPIALSLSTFIGMIMSGMLAARSGMKLLWLDLAKVLLACNAMATVMWMFSSANGWTGVAIRITLGASSLIMVIGVMYNKVIRNNLASHRALRR